MGRMEIAGGTCSVCGQKIVFAEAGKRCLHCGIVVHAACDAQASVRGVAERMRFISVRLLIHSKARLYRGLCELRLRRRWLSFLLWRCFSFWRLVFLVMFLRGIR